MRHYFLLLLLFISNPAIANDDLKRLQAELDAQRALNEILKSRNDALLSQLNGDQATAVKTNRSPEASDSDTAQPLATERALEQALLRRGLTVLPADTTEITPSALLSYSGSDAISNRNQLAGVGVGIRQGLNNGWMLGASVPYYYRNVDNSPNNNGIGDTRLSVWKSLRNPGRDTTGITAGFFWTLPTGDNLGDSTTPLGSGFHQLTGQLSFVYRQDPIAWFGSASWTEFTHEDIDDIDLSRSGRVRFTGGANLAVTPDVSLSIGLDFSREQRWQLDGVSLPGSEQTVGLLTLGSGWILSNGQFISLSAGIGITDDAPDFSLGLATPIRF